MRDFFRFFFASLLALLVFSIIVFFFITGLISGIAKQFEDDKVSVEPNSILKLNANYPIAEQTQTGMPSAFALITLDADKALGLNDILADIKHAETDDNIKGIYLELGLNPNSYATLQEIRDALIDFKKNSGKFVIAYGEVISQTAYYLGSVADKIYLNPSGAVDFKGLSAKLAFYKGTLDKLGIKAQVFYDGKFKSATEPFRMEKMSEENRLQLEEFINQLFDANLNEINAVRPKSTEHYRMVADSLLAWYSTEAVEVGLIDELKYHDQVLDEIKSRCGLSSSDSIPFISMQDYRNAFKEKSPLGKSRKETIAIVYANGTIIDGEGESGYIGSKTFSEIFTDIREDESIKAVVLRVNSPGGSAVASDVMWREIEITKKIKPIIVSMGDYAASGGYMIACNANKIYAQPNTLTGSIGVFLIVPEITEFMDDKLGITYDTASTSPYADFPSVTRPFYEREKQILQAGVDSTYLKFKQRVATGRNLSMEQVEEMAQGRIWTGTKAKELQLVDSIGGIDEAINSAKELVGLKDYNIVEYPKQEESIIDEIIYSLSQETEAKITSEKLGILYPHYQTLKTLIERPVMQARLPYEIVIE
jgi:protease-4